MQITLRAGEEIFINGALLRVDRKVSLEIVNNATFLLGAHVLSQEEANTPLRQLYFAMQKLLISPECAVEAYRDCILLLHASQKTFLDKAICAGLEEIHELVRGGKWYQALKLLRKIFYLEDAYISSMQAEKAMVG